ncbi:hypothetical protein GCM10009126_15290 [Rhodanobacter caeni]|uniref:Addiction module toxin, HicA family n=1 Tax=Rhodanobacter caeni TaxID=657654 RepID=A0ABP3E2M8_9GAMM
MKYCKDKDIAALVRGMIREGWRCRMGGRHGKLISPHGGWMTVPCTPGDHRALQNFKRDLRKLTNLSAT